MQDQKINESLWVSPLGSQLFIYGHNFVIWYGCVVKLIIICTPFEAPLQILTEFSIDVTWFYNVQI